MEIPKATHATGVFHIKGQPIPMIFDDNEVNVPRYDTFMQDSLQYSLSATEVYEEIHDGDTIPRGIAITLKLKTSNDFMEFVIIPDDEFVTELVTGKKLYFGNSKGISFFQIDIDTKPIENVWEPSRS